MQVLSFKYVPDEHTTVGDGVGACVGMGDGSSVGKGVGDGVGACVGMGDGSSVGKGVGVKVGIGDGRDEGEVGTEVGTQVYDEGKLSQHGVPKLFPVLILLANDTTEEESADTSGGISPHN
jgi:hypothetical protein